MTELCDLPAVELRRLIGEKALSPVELLAACRARIAQINPALNAVVAEDFARAEAAARVAEAEVMGGEGLGPLHGLPLGIKDLQETEGLRTTHGSLLFADHVPERDCWLVARLRAAGGIVVVKTNTPEFGAGAITDNAVYGFTGNPFDPNRSCGGSSGGSAVALATGMVPLATGSDLGGSLRIPAAYCGVVGFRPSAGMVPRPETGLAWSPLSVDGPLARTVADLALLQGAIIGREDADPLSWGASAAEPGGLEPIRLKSLKVAISEDLGFAPIARAERQVFRRRLGLFADVFRNAEEADPDLRGADRVFEVLRGVLYLAKHHRQLAETPDKLGLNVIANVEQGLTFSAEDVAEALVEQTAIFRRFGEFMSRYDLLLCPTVAVGPVARDAGHPREIDGQPLATYFSWIAMTYGLTLTAHPVITLPCGRDESGMPWGLQIVGRRGEEWRLLSAAQALEARLAEEPECRRPRPDLAALASSGG